MSIGHLSSRLFAPARLGSLTLRNRVIRAGCYEGMSRAGAVTADLIEHHRRLAQGEIAMTTVAYLAVSPDGRGFSEQVWLRDEILLDLRRLTHAVHRESGAVSAQLVHCGSFADPKVIGATTIGPSKKYCTYRMSSCRAMSEDEIHTVTAKFGKAAAQAVAAGFDAIEVHAGHGYLLSQFMSPWTNARGDQFGGSLENRLRFPAAVVRAVRDAVGPKVPVLVKMNMRDGFKGGWEIDDAIGAAQTFEREGATALVPSGGFVSRTPFYMLRGRLPVAEMAANRTGIGARLALQVFGRLMVPRHRYSAMFFLDDARRIRDAVKIPTVYMGGATAASAMHQAIEEGFGFVQVGRATIRDAEFVRKIHSGAVTESDCDHCNRCVAAMDAGRVYCVSEKKGLLRS